ncbi:hypothetical protein BN10_590014 [Phycicoccus elongatus Lp2]|uniref:Uncharacterized protein n=1 Tax=Phycicoccus elongatus Lp2 TaxID=1193181 RepID=N0E0T2_9MICO|nr:hypothetical protein BN10_590014 [Phycicoccus elongatus Lp2]
MTRTACLVAAVSANLRLRKSAVALLVSWASAARLRQLRGGLGCSETAPDLLPLVGLTGFEPAAP